MFVKSNKQSGTGRKTFHAKSMPFLKDSLQLINFFTIDGFSFQLVFLLKIGRFHLNDKFWMENPSKKSFSLQIWHPIGQLIAGLMM